MKVCSKCNESKHYSEFYKDKSKSDGYHFQCKSCHYKHKKLNNKKLKGVYGIFSGNKCLYVGESDEMKNRIWCHKSNIKNITTNVISQKELYIRMSGYDDIQIKILEETPNHKERESYWIDKLHPLYNS